MYFLNPITSVDICITGWSQGLVYPLLQVEVHIALTIVTNVIFIDLRCGKSYLNHDKTNFASWRTQFMRINFVHDRINLGYDGKCALHKIDEINTVVLFHWML